MPESRDSDMDELAPIASFEQVGDENANGVEEASAVGATQAGAAQADGAHEAGASGEPAAEGARGQQDEKSEPGEQGEGVAAALSSLKEGLDAIGAVRDAAKRHAGARSQLKELKRELEKTQEVLDHRVEIEASFDQIVRDETANAESARAEIAQAEADTARLGAERDALEAQLKAMREAHETAIRPYRDLMESTRGRSDDAAKSLAEIRRAVKSADQQVADAAKRREQRIADANRSVDNAQERLRRVEGELASMQSGSASPAALSKMQAEVVTERAHRDAARSNVARVTAEGQQLVDNAQTHLWTQKQSLETIERQAEEAKREADERREEYERLYNANLAEEKALEEQVNQRKKSLEETARAKADAEERAGAAEAALEEAREIHATPEVTEQLRHGIQEGESALARQQSEVDSLADTERRLRESTRSKRFLFIGVAVAVVVVVVLVVVLLTRGA